MRYPRCGLAARVRRMCRELEVWGQTPVSAAYLWLPYPYRSARWRVFVPEAPFFINARGD